MRCFCIQKNGQGLKMIGKWWPKKKQSLRRPGLCVGRVGAAWNGCFVNS